MNIRPLGNRIIISPDEAVTEVNDMVLPDSAVEKPVTGKVLKVGPKVDQSFVKEGDVVVYSPFAIMNATVYGEKITYVREDDILFVIANS